MSLSVIIKTIFFLLLIFSNKSQSKTELTAFIITG